MTEKFSDYIVVFVLVFPLSCYYNSITLDRDVYNKQLAAAFSFVYLLLKMSRGKRWKWHFRDPEFKNFLREHSFKISRYTPV